MGNAITWEPKELAYLQSRDWDVLRQKLFATDLEITELLGVFREIDYRGKGLIGRIEFYLHFKYPFITPMADKLFHAFSNGSSEMDFRCFCASVLTMAQASEDTLINFLFDMYDTDQNKTMDTAELKECLEDVFGPPEQAEWFSILNECTRSLVNKYTKMGEVELSRKMFREMIKSNEPLMAYLPVFVLQRDMRDKTLGAHVFEDKPQLETMPHNFIDTTFAKTHGELGREGLQAKMVKELKEAEEQWRREKLTRTKDGLRQLKLEEHSHLSFTRERPQASKPRKPRVVHVQSKERFTLAKNKVVEKKLSPEEKAEAHRAGAAAKQHEWLHRGDGTKQFSPKMAMLRSRYRSEKKEVPYYVPRRGEDHL